MRSLFWKIFLWFWLAMGAVTVSAILVVVATQGEPVPPAWRETFVNLLTIIGREATARIDRDGREEADRNLRRYLANLNINAVVYDAEGKLLLGTPFADTPVRLIRQTIADDQPIFELSPDRMIVARPFTDPGGRRYIILADVPRGRSGRFVQTIEIRLLRILAMLATAGIVCLALTRYLVGPISRLREATQRLAAGDLSVRTHPMLGNRRDELG